MKQAVINWLKNPDRRYGDGVSFFEAIASDNLKEKYLDYFKRKTDIHLLMDKLRRSLHLIPAGMKSTLVNPIPVLGAPELQKKPIAEPTKPTPENKHLFDRLAEIRPLQASIHNSLYDAADPSKRKTMVLDLLKLEQDRKSIWKEIDGNEEKEAIPEIEENPVERGARLQKRAKQLRQNISRGKCSETKKAAYQTELDEIMKELNPYGKK